ncbi:BamA/TamA family outer membrane protein [Sediminitomix flava]|uniref:Surface antigen-like protein n=1 Tax=Sediminitomix flava TaxID=379075 RepID=A0A315ZGV2_SEDFL|nr:BamA/TamA family outer membrane protein [Sediminitomix flava]PWJ44816.1 surface antigen-like protein [Sediminitomix flava]
MTLSIRLFTSMNYYFKHLLFILLFVIGINISTNAQENIKADSTALLQETDTTKQEKNFRFSILGGPGYTPDFGFLIGGSMLFTFRTEDDPDLKRSVVPFAFAVMFEGGLNLLTRPQLFFNEDRFRLFGNFSYVNIQDNYYGVGFETNKNTERSSSTTEFRRTGYQINPIFLFKIADSDFYIGPSLDFLHSTMDNPSEGVVNDPNYIEQGGTEDGIKYYSSGIGLNLSYDTRDIPANPYKGMLLEANATYYADIFGATNSYSVYTLQYRQFQSLPFIGERKVLAWHVKTRLTTGDVPLTSLSIVGSPFDIRGYYAGQYRDANSLLGVVEYRHMFNTPGGTKFSRLLSKTGFAVWGGMGTIGPSLDELSEILPNYGIGLRIEVQPRMNFRIDVGKNPINNQTLLYFNMTEAF